MRILSVLFLIAVVVIALLLAFGGSNTLAPLLGSDPLYHCKVGEVQAEDGGCVPIGFYLDTH